MGNRRRPLDNRAEMRQLKADADALDLRRRKQIGNQIASINRLLEDGSYDAEMAELHRRLAESEAQLEEARGGAPAPVYSLGGA